MLFRSHPDDTLTRAQFVTLVASALDLPAGKGGQFSDVQEGQWFAAPVSAMTDMGFLSGRGDGTFGPNDTITYQEMVTVLSNVAAWTSMDGYDLNKSDLLPEELVEYYDWAEWARVPARNLDALEALTGELAPTDLVTRELAAATLCRLMESTHLIWN